MHPGDKYAISIKNARQSGSNNPIVYPEICLYEILSLIMDASNNVGDCNNCISCELDVVHLFDRSKQQNT